MKSFEDKLLKTLLYELKSYKPFTKEEEQKIFQEYAKTKSKELKHKIILHNQRLVINIAKKFFKSGQSKMDLISVGNIGLMKAIDNFNPDYKMKFSTYAYFWINTSISHFVYQNSTIVHIPRYIIDLHIKIYKFRKNYYFKHGKEPTKEEIAKHIGMTLKEYEKKIEFEYRELSMDFKIDEDSNDFISIYDDTDFTEEMNKIYKKERIDILKKLLKKLPERIRDIITLRFGLDGCGFKTLDEVAKIMQISKERVRQLINIGLDKVKEMYFNKKELIMNDLKSLIRDVPDFPVKGIIFKDITTLLKDNGGFKTAIDAMAHKLKNVEFDKIAAIESRGFIFGSVLAYILEKPLILVRKKGKLPAETISVTYELEYGRDTLEMHKDSIKEGDKFVIVDDLLATGGTVKAVADLINDNGGEVVAALFLIELTFLKAREKLNNLTIFNIIEY